MFVIKSEASLTDVAGCQIRVEDSIAITVDGSKHIGYKLVALDWRSEKSVTLANFTNKDSAIHAYDMVTNAMRDGKYFRDISDIEYNDKLTSNEEETEQ